SLPDIRAARAVRDLDADPQLLEGLAIFLLVRRAALDPSNSPISAHEEEPPIMRLTARRTWTAVAAALVLVTGLAGCRSEETPPSGGGDGAIKTDFGVTEEPCPNAIDSNKGCIYLGIISDLTVGPFAPLAVPITEAQKAFWNRVNKNGGIGGQYEVDVTTYIRDNKYNPQTHNEVYQEIKPNILALAQTLGSPTTAAILEDL